MDITRIATKFGVTIDNILEFKPRELHSTDGHVIVFRWDVNYFVPAGQHTHVMKGLCMSVAGVPAGGSLLEVKYARYVHTEWNRKPVALMGVWENAEDISLALIMLLDTKRAYRTYRQCEDARYHRLRRSLAEATAGLKAANDIPVGPDAQARTHRYLAIESAERELNRRVDEAIRDGLCSLAQIAEITGIPELLLDARRTDESRAPYYVGIDGLAQRVGLSSSTIRSVRSAGKVPTPDTLISGSPAWSLETADAYALRLALLGH